MNHPERNARVAAPLRGVLNAFAGAQSVIDAATIPAERSAELQAERLAEWREDDRDSLTLDREGRPA